MGKTAIVYGSDSNGFGNLEISAWSARKFIGDDVDMYIVTDSYFSPRVYGMGCVCPTDVFRRLGIFPGNWNRGWPFATLFRMAIPLLPAFDGYAKAIYVDNDILFKDMDARGILDIDVNGVEITGAPDVKQMQGRTGGVIDSDVPARFACELNDRIWRQNDPRRRKYINAGLQIMNLEQIRKNGIEWYERRLKMFWEIEVHGGFRFLDQDFANVMMDTSDRLPQEFNDVFDLVKGAHVTHYVSGVRDRFVPTAIALGYTRAAQHCAELPALHEEDIGVRQLVVYMCHVVNEESLWRYRKLKDDLAALPGTDVVLYLDATGGVPSLSEDVKPVLYTQDDVRKSCEYSRVFRPEGSIVPYVIHRASSDDTEGKYKYIWTVEYDVCFSGNWADFFRKMSSVESDFAAERTRCFFDDPEWCWWKNCDFSATDRSVSYAGLLCIQRSSRRMCKWVHDWFARNNNQDRNNLFQEYTVPTIAVSNGSLYDFSDLCSQKFKAEPLRTHEIRTVDRNRLYHAVKLDVKWRDVKWEK